VKEQIPSLGSWEWNLTPLHCILCDTYRYYLFYCELNHVLLANTPTTSELYEFSFYDLLFSI
jgi:hypothetical protein